MRRWERLPKMCHQVQLLILCATRLGEGMPDRGANIRSGCVYEGVSGKTLAFKWIDQVKMCPPMCVGVILSFEDMRSTKKGRQGEFAVFVLELEHPTSPALGHWTPGSWTLGLKLNYTIGSPGSPDCRRQMVGLSSLRNHRS